MYADAMPGLSTATIDTAARMLIALPALNYSEQSRLLLALLRVAYAEGGQHAAELLAASHTAAITIHKAKATP